MKDKVLVITSSHDKTCDYLISKYKDVDFFRFNIDKFSLYKVSILSGEFEIKSSLLTVSNKTCKSIYFRKPMQEDLREVYDEKYHQFSYRESYSLVEGLVESFSGKCLSKPSLMRRAGNKVFQAIVANDMGFNIPELTITNSAENIRDFCKDESIVKPLSVGTIVSDKKKEFVQTNLYDENFDLSLLRYTPSYFQRYIDKDYEVRVTFVGRKAFSVKIISDNRIDWRKPENKVSYSIFELPDSIYGKCLNYLDYTNMKFGCFDFVVLEDEWYFLEMNSNGQWAWLEFETGLPISKEVIGYLND